MKILFIGDIVGKPGREAVQKILPRLRREEGIQVVIANGENAAHGRGITHEIVEEMLACGVNFFTTGNHIWDVKDLVHHLKQKGYPVLRPANYPDANPGRGYDIIETALLKRLLIINIQGRVFMPEGLDSPFQRVDEILRLHEKDHTISAILVDFHAEVTSEKHAMRHFLDGRVSALFGTHTHVQTNDAHISPAGTAYITDAGMTGVYWDSVIGLHKQSSLDLFLLANVHKWEMAEGKSLFQAVLIETDDRTRQATSIRTIQEEA